MSHSEGKFWNKVFVTIFVAFCAILITVIFKYEVILNKFEDFLIVSDRPKGADVIVVLAGDDMDLRVVYGVKLYKLGYGNKILMSGGPCYWNSTVAEIMKQHALHLGVSADDILLEDKSNTSYENAKYSLDIMTHQGLRSAIVVTSPYHTRRARVIFEQIFGGKGIDLTICAFQLSGLNSKDWWRDEMKTRFIVNEYIKLMWHYLFTRGSNK